MCLTIAAAAVPEAAEVRLLEDPVGFLEDDGTAHAARLGWRNTKGLRV